MMWVALGHFYMIGMFAPLLRNNGDSQKVSIAKYKKNLFIDFTLYLSFDCVRSSMDKRETTKLYKMLYRRLTHSF